MRRETLEKIYLSIVILCMLFYVSSTMLAINTEGSVRAYSVLPTAILFVLLSVYLFFNIRRLPTIQKIVRLFVVLYSGIFLITVIFADEKFPKDLFFLLVKTLVTPLAFLYLYNVSRQYDIKSIFIKYSLFSTIILFLCYLYIYSYLNSERTEEGFASVNAGYFLLLILPSVLSSRKFMVRLFEIVLVSLAIFSGMKRGGLIALFLSITLYFFVDNILISGKRLKFSTILLVVFFVGLFTFAFIKYDESTGGYFGDRLENMQEDRGSNRLDVYEETISLIERSSVTGIFFGHGYEAVKKDSQLELSAHNDFLEVFYDYGLIICVLYLFLHILLIRLSIQLIRQKSQLAASMAMSYVIFIVLSMASHLIIYNYFILLTFFWGMICGLSEREQYKIFKNESCK